LKHKKTTHKCNENNITKYQISNISDINATVQ